MTSPAITVDSSMGVLDALALMTQRRIRHLPVVDGGQLRGIVSIGDLVKYRMDRIEAEAEAIAKALDETNWNRKQAAALLQISYKALLYKIRQYGIAQQNKNAHKLSAGA